MAFFGRKTECQKLAKTKANPLQKCQFLAKNCHFLSKFFRTKKRLQMTLNESK